MEQMYFVVEEEQDGMRLDVYLVDQMPGHSRSQLQRRIQDGHITVNREQTKPGHALAQGDSVEVEIPAPPEDTTSAHVPLDILFEDEHLVAVDKQVGLVIHPGIENQTGTLVQALRTQGHPLVGGEDPERPGVVHRLDKETSGVIVLSKSDLAYESLVEQFSARLVNKYYLAVVHPQPGTELGRIEAPIGRDVRHPAKMAVSKQGGKQAITEFRVLNSHEDCSLLLVKLLTGRTHQIRVHFEAIGHAIAGDKIYSGSSKSACDKFDRMMLHAWQLEIAHPATGERMGFTAPPPGAFERYLDGADLDGALAVFESSSEDNQDLLDSQ